VPTYYSFSAGKQNGIISEYNFTLDEPVFLKAQLEFYFWNDDLSVEIITPGGNSLIGYNEYNNNYLATELSPGNYTMRLLYGAGFGPNSNYVVRRCSAFNFQLSIKPLGGASNLSCWEVPLTSFFLLRYI